MGTLYIDKKDLHIKLDGNALAFYCNGGREGTVPIGQLKRVVIVGKTTIDTPVLHRLAEDNISVIFLSGRSMKFCGMLHGRLHNNAIVRVRQYEKSTQPDFALHFSSQIVREKLKGQINFLDEIKSNRKDIGMPLIEAINTITSVIEKIGSASSITTLMGFEGGASAIYFGAFVKAFAPSLNFTKRTRRPPKDPVNAMLSLCYTMIHFEMVREIELIGLDPTVGFYHQFEYGRESLASDLVEPFRVEVDRFVYELFRDKEFESKDFYMDEETLGYYLKKEGRKRFYPIYEEWIKGKRTLFTDTVRTLARRLADGQDIIPE